MKLKDKEATIKYRLYEIEERFQESKLIRISNSEIVNFEKVKSLDMSMSGIVSLKLDIGEKTFVSRCIGDLSPRESVMISEDIDLIPLDLCRC